MVAGKLAPSFDEPLEMLGACHERIEAQLGTLERLVEHLARHGSDAGAKGAVRAVMRYFDTAAVNHHDDEDADLFPMLRAAAAGGGRDEIGAVLYELEKEHKTMDLLYQRLRAQLDAVAQGRGERLDAEIVGRFAWIYRRHMGVESEVVLPFAREALDPEQRAALGRCMAARRGAATMARS